MAALDQQGSPTTLPVAPVPPPSRLTLPPLGKRGYAIFRIVWGITFLLAVVALGVGNYLDHMRKSNAPFGHLGLSWYQDEGQIRLNEPWSNEAKQSGIRKGDMIVAIDGRAVGSQLGWANTVDAMLIRPEGAQVALTVRSADGTTSTHRLTRRKAHLDLQFAGTGLNGRGFRWINRIADLLPDLFLLAAGILLVKGRRRDAVPALLSLSLVLLAASGPGTWSFYHPAPFAKDVIGTLGAVGLVIGLLAFPDGRFGSRWTVALAAIAVLWGVAFLFTGSGVSNDVAVSALLLSCVVAMARRYRRTMGSLERQQVRWVLLGFAWGTTFLFATMLLAWAGSNLPPRSAERLWVGIGTSVLSGMGVGMLALGLIVSLLRYRLYDVDSLISRSAAYGALTGGFVAVFAGSEKVLEAVGQRYFEGEAGALSGGMAAAVAALAIVPLHRRLHGWAERRFQKSLLHLREDLPARVGDLRETEPMPELAAQVLGSMIDGVRARHAALMVDGKLCDSAGISADAVTEWCGSADLDPGAQSLDCRPEDSIFPVRIPLRANRSADRQPLGWILLGPRPDGSFYGQDEREALAEVAVPIARAVRVVQLRDEREAKLIALVERRLRAMERQLRSLQGPQGRKHATAAK